MREITNQVMTLAVTLETSAYSTFNIALHQIIHIESSQNYHFIRFQIIGQQIYVLLTNLRPTERE